MSNIYYNPESFDLTTFGQIDWEPDEEYNFDLTVIWRDSDGMYYWAEDSGCSCPSPFGSIQGTWDENLSRGSSAIDVVRHLGNESGRRGKSAMAILPMMMSGIN